MIGSTSSWTQSLACPSPSGASFSPDVYENIIGVIKYMTCLTNTYITDVTAPFRDARQIVSQLHGLKHLHVRPSHACVSSPHDMDVRMGHGVKNQGGIERATYMRDGPSPGLTKP